MIHTCSYRRHSGVFCAGSDDDERAVKEATSATLRCFPFEQPASVGKCLYTGTQAAEVAIFAKAY
jgi:prolyl-tRNA synthetase